MSTAIAAAPTTLPGPPRAFGRLAPHYPRGPALAVGMLVVLGLFWLLGHLLNPRAAAGPAMDRDLAVLPVSRADPRALPPAPDTPRPPPPTPRPDTPPPPAPSAAPADAASAAATAAAQAAAATPPPPALAQLAAAATPPALNAPVPDIAFDLPPVPTVNPATLSIAAPAGLESRGSDNVVAMAEALTALPVEAMGTLKPIVLSFPGGAQGGAGSGAGTGRGRGQGTGVGPGAGMGAGTGRGAGSGAGAGSGGGGNGNGNGSGPGRPVPRAADRAPPRFTVGQGFTGAELVPLSTARPQMPADACRKKIRGVVEVVFYVGPDGHVFDPAVVAATPPGVFEAAALESVTYWIYPRDKYGRYREVQQKIPMLPEDCAYNYGASRAE